MTDFALPKKGGDFGNKGWTGSNAIGVDEERDPHEPNKDPNASAPRPIALSFKK